MKKPIMTSRLDPGQDHMPKTEFLTVSPESDPPVNPLAPVWSPAN